jgi:hypothetical protein
MSVAAMLTDSISRRIASALVSGSLVAAAWVATTLTSTPGPNDAASTPRLSSQIRLAACECHPSSGGPGDGVCRGCDGFGDTITQGGTANSTCGKCSGSGNCHKCLDAAEPLDVQRAEQQRAHPGPMGGPAAGPMGAATWEGLLS